MFRRIATVFVLLSAFTAFASASSIDMSDSASLSDLLNGGSLSLGSISIDGFSSNELIAPNGGTVTPVDPSTVTVNADLVCGTKINLSFDGFVASASNGGTYDYLIDFDISGASGGISDVTLSQLAGGTPTGSASFANITEVVVDNNDFLNSVGLTTDTNNPTAIASLGTAATSVSVSKDILLQSFAGSTVQISRFSQMYAVPEPSSIALGLFGLVGAMGMTRRRRR